MSSSESVLPPELIHMVMSYLSDEEKMRLIKIDPSTFDVLTSDERFKAEFNTREFYMVLLDDGDYQEAYVSEISNDPEYIIGEIIRQIFYLSKIEIDRREEGTHIDTFLQCVPPVNLGEARLNAIRDLSDHILAFGALKKDHFEVRIRRYITLHQYPNDDSIDLEMFADINSVRDNLRQKVQNCFEGARLSELDTIADLVLMALQTHCLYKQRVLRTKTVSVMKVDFDRNMRTTVIGKSKALDLSSSLAYTL